MVLEPTSPAPARATRRVAVPNATDAQRLVSNTRRKLADMPAVPKQMNAIAVLLVYTASGLSDDEIAVATGITHEQIATIRAMSAYAQLEAYMIGAVKDQTQADVKAILSGAEIAAANAIATQVNHNHPDIAYRASKDILDRGGHVPAQKVDIMAQMRGTLRIEVVDKRGTAVPTLDMEVDT